MNSPDYSVIDKLGLELPAIGVYYDLFKPEGIPQLDTSIEKSLCEILRYSQEKNEPFYFANDNPETCVGKIMLGMDSFPPSAESGQIGERLGVFDSPRCNARLYYSVKRLTRGTVNYVSFVPHRCITKTPDVLIFAGTPSQMEPVMRAATYSTGISYTSQSTAVMGCSWFMVYPYMTGNINFVVPAFIHGPHGRRLWPENTVVVSVPYQWAPTVIGNLEKMPLHLTGHESKEKYYSEFGGILADLDEKMKNL
ncbi:MAG: DUF169 domain-containing protein [Oscillospiraceae bacterium]|nr:DUF169 domain-containing protein [Oscillospiraceae bacterium]